MPIPAWTVDDHLSAAQGLLPRGRAWPRDPSSVQAQTLRTLVATFKRLTDRGAYLLTDAFPATANELLPEWESSLGLPDPCAGESPTIELRQSQVVARLAAGGGQSIAFFTDFAKTLGFEITVTQYKPFRAGSKAGTPLYGNDWAFAWQVTAVSGADNAVLQCEFQRLSPAHTIVNFSYTS